MNAKKEGIFNSGDNLINCYVLSHCYGLWAIDKLQLLHVKKAVWTNVNRQISTFTNDHFVLNLHEWYKWPFPEDSIINLSVKNSVYDRTSKTCISTCICMSETMTCKNSNCTYMYMYAKAILNNRKFCYLNNKNSRWPQ